MFKKILVFVLTLICLTPGSALAYEKIQPEVGLYQFPVSLEREAGSATATLVDKNPEQIQVSKSTRTKNNFAQIATANTNAVAASEVNYFGLGSLTLAYVLVIFLSGYGLVRFVRAEESLTWQRKAKF